MRYALSRPDEVAERFGVDGPMPALRPRYNIAPTQEVPVIFAENGEIRCSMAQWGLVPSWKQTAESGEWLFNARAETLEEKPAFRGLLSGSRCIFPATGFYEWKRERGRSFPYYVYLRDAPLFACAGLYDRWRPPGLGEERMTCVMITCDANPLVGKIHGRMPVILAQPLEDVWLRGKEDYLPVLTPFPAGGMGCHHVDERVNAPVDDDPGLIIPVHPDHRWW
ncbi:hypothetical protein AZH53_05260 [Methanomicrobiaceae archaeon CYW5]|uniref:SOS response-associated peptidase n=1 Tax=Methanovulcanius yangii TaxID=1789227 RepID=UPI0029CA97EA|nr:SOS response-associated peptidase [Methanovulcanius yangii]MBT8507825.1 hypothetical protein [Methanovulcanius yangii]